MPTRDWGEARITPINETEVLFRSTIFYPDASIEALASVPWLGEPHVTEKGHIRLMIRAFVIETPLTRIVVDTCMGNDKPRDWAAANMLKTNFIEKMAAAGYPRETIDVVLCTHLHVDHVGWNTMLVDGVWRPTFPNARYLFARTEFEHCQAQEDAEDRVIFSDSIAPVVDAGLVDLVEVDHRIDQWVKLVPTHGHTPGHVSVLVGEGERQALITGDSFHSPVQVAFPQWGTVADHDMVASRRMRETILSDLSSSSCCMLGTHFPEPAAGRIIREGCGFRFVPLDDG